MASVRDFIEAGQECKRQIAASNPIRDNFRHLRTYQVRLAGVESLHSDAKFAPPGVETSDGYTATEDWELCRITIPPETDSVGWITKPGYSVEVAITERGIVAFRKERPGWKLGNRYDSWQAVDTDRLNVHLDQTRFIQEQTFHYNLSLLDGEDPMSEQEMAEIMEVGEVADEKAEREECKSCEFRTTGRIFAAYGTKSICQECLERKAREENEAIAAEHQKPKHSDWNMMQKDDEISLLQQRIDHLERENEALRAGLSSEVYDRKMSAVYGVDWKAIREARENESERETPGA